MCADSPTMKYRVVLEYDSETRHYTATVPGLPGLVVDAKTERVVLRLAREGIRFYLDELKSEKRGNLRKMPRPLSAKIRTVDI